MDRGNIIKELEDKFRPFTGALYDELKKQEFVFVEQKNAHLQYLDWRLIVRHSLPYCITEETYFNLADVESVKFFAAIILLHSLALTRIDDYYDGGDKTKSGRKLDVEALAYSLSATHEALKSLLSLTPNTRGLKNLLSITNFVHSRMYKDYTERYRIECLERPGPTLEAYLHSPTSRLLGSGYWEVMARASFVRQNKTFPSYLHVIDIKLRKFRQMIDELADIDEDLRGGLVTLPILHALSAHPQSGKLKQGIEDYWKGDLEASPPQLHILLEESNTKQWIYKQAVSLYYDAMSEVDAKLGKRGDGYRRLFDYKKAKLEGLLA